MPVLTLDQIESLCVDALKLAGASDDQAAIFAEELWTPRLRAFSATSCEKTTEVVLFKFHCACG